MGTAVAIPGRPKLAVGGTIRGVETFAVCEVPGNTPGEKWKYTDADLDAIVRNFAVLSAGENPAHTVPVVQTHDGVNAHGRVTGITKTGELLLTDWDEVSPDLYKKIRNKRLPKVSPEIDRDFKDKDGNIIAKGPYLYRVAVIGADVPRVKGLADVEAYADRVFKFADSVPRITTMDRVAAVKFLAEMGVDAKSLESSGDAVLIDVATRWQADNVMPPVPTPPVPTPPVVVAPPVPAVPIAQPVQAFADPAVVRQFVQQTVAEIVGRETKTLTDAVAAENKARDQRAAEERAAGVRLFCDRMATDKRISPADNDEGSPLSVRSRLLRLAVQPPTVHRFTDPATKKEVARTELELQQDAIERQPVQRFAERVKAGGVDGAGGTTPDEDEYARRTREYWEKRGKRIGVGGGVGNN